MAELDLSKDIVTMGPAQFVPLGKRASIFKLFTHKLENDVLRRIKGETKKHVNGFWGTLGREDSGSIEGWTGTLHCSGKGNDRSTGDLSRIIDAIKAAYPDPVKFEEEPILEKFIAFDDMQFGSDAGSRNLRLTVMLEENETAIAFYHHGELGSDSSSGPVEYILSENTNEEAKQTGRKNFLFEVPDTAAAHNSIDGAEAQPEGRFVVKVMVFRYEDDKEGRREKYNLLRYNHAREHGFDTIEPSDIDFSKRTLLLLHGTIATTEVSFRGLHKNEEEDQFSLLKYFLDHPAEGYEQIIAFDHITLFHNTLENVEEFKRRLDVVPGWKFTHPVDIIATSRGCLVAKTMAGDAELNSAGGKMRIEKIVLVSCPNGAALLDVENKLAMRIVLTVLAAFTGPIAPGVFLMLQNSAGGIFRSPGLLVQTKGHEFLDHVLSINPAWERTRYYPICGNYKASKKKRLDFLIDKVLTDSNDWVNYTSRMNIMPANRLAYGHPPEFFLNEDRLANAIHTAYFATKGEPLPAQFVREFLTDKSEKWLGN